MLKALALRGGAVALALSALLMAVPDTTAAADPRPGVKRVTSLMEMRRHNVVLQEWDLSCGAAALATLLQYQHGLPITERDIAATMLTGTDRRLVQIRMGFSLLDMKQFANAVGLEATGYGKVTLEDLADLVPAIVPIHVTATFSHFVVVRGIVGDRVVLADPAFGNRSVSIQKFEDIWKDDVAFVIERRDGQAPANRLLVSLNDYRLPQAAALRRVVH